MVVVDVIVMVHVAVVGCCRPCTLKPTNLKATSKDGKSMDKILMQEKGPPSRIQSLSDPLATIAYSVGLGVEGSGLRARGLNFGFIV